MDIILPFLWQRTHSCGLPGVDTTHSTPTLLKIYTHSYSLPINCSYSLRPTHSPMCFLSSTHFPTHSPTQTGLMNHAQAVEIIIPLASVICSGLCTRPQVNQYKSFPWLSYRRISGQSARPTEKHLLSDRENSLKDTEYCSQTILGNRV